MRDFIERIRKREPISAPNIASIQKDPGNGDCDLAVSPKSQTPQQRGQESEWNRRKIRWNIALERCSTKEYRRCEVFRPYWESSGQLLPLSSRSVSSSG